MEQFITGEKVRIDYEIASVWLRIASYCIDIAFQTAAFFVFYFIFIFSMAGGAVFSEAVIKTNENAITALMIIEVILFLLLLLFLLFYRLFFELIWKGQTPGKRILKIRVIMDDGTYLKVMPAILRNLFRIIDYLPFNNVAGFITMLVNKKHKRIGDIIAGTIVIQEQKIILPDTVKEIKLECFSEIKDIKGLFGSNEKDIFKSYYIAKKELDPVPFGIIQNKIIDLIELRTGVKKPDNVNKEDFIMAVYTLIK